MTASGARVVVVTHYWAPHVGGIETVARQQAVGLAGRGFDVDVHTTRLPRCASRSSDERTVLGAGRVVVSRHRAVEPLLRTAQLPVPVPGPGMVVRLVRAIRRADVVVAHGHSFPTSVLAAGIARVLRRPFVLVQHSPWIAYGTVLEAVQRIVDRTVGRWVLTAADAVVCVSEHTAGYVRSMLPTAPVHVVHNGVDRDRFHPATGRGADPRVGAGVDAEGRSGRPVVLFVGRLVERNGWRVLLEAWRGSSLPERADLRIVGSGPDELRVRAAIHDLDRVVQLGTVADDELADHYRAAHVVVVPTLTGVGFGLTAAEALACGTPVVASAEGGHREVVRDGIDGLLVSAGDAAALTEALERILTEEGLRERLATAARDATPSSRTPVDGLHEVLAGTVARVRGARGWV